MSVTIFLEGMHTAATITIVQLHGGNWGTSSPLSAHTQTTFVGAKDTVQVHREATCKKAGSQKVLERKKIKTRCDSQHNYATHGDIQRSFMVHRLMKADPGSGHSNRESNRSAA